MDSGRGTVWHEVPEQIFRKKVESLLGCIIAKNAVMSSDDYEIVSSFKSAQRRIQQCIDKASELEIQKKGYVMTRNGLNEDVEKQYCEFLDNMITRVEADIKANAESKAKAEADEKKYSKQATAILKGIKTLK